MMGMPWWQQKLSGTVLDVLEEVRQAMRDGEFNPKAFDHNHPDRVEGESNKRVYIAAARLLEREPADMVEAWAAVLEAILGRRT